MKSERKNESNRIFNSEQKSNNKLFSKMNSNNVYYVQNGSDRQRNVTKTDTCSSLDQKKHDKELKYIRNQNFSSGKKSETIKKSSLFTNKDNCPNITMTKLNSKQFPIDEKKNLDSYSLFESNIVYNGEASDNFESNNFSNNANVTRNNLVSVRETSEQLNPVDENLKSLDKNRSIQANLNLSRRLQQTGSIKSDLYSNHVKNVSNNESNNQAVISDILKNEIIRKISPQTNVTNDNQEAKNQDSSEEILKDMSEKSCKQSNKNIYGTKAFMGATFPNNNATKMLDSSVKNQIVDIMLAKGLYKESLVREKVKKFHSVNHNTTDVLKIVDMSNHNRTNHINETLNMSRGKLNTFNNSNSVKFFTGDKVNKQSSSVERNKAIDKYLAHKNGMKACNKKFTGYSTSVDLRKSQISRSQTKNTYLDILEKSELRAKNGSRDTRDFVGRPTLHVKLEEKKGHPVNDISKSRENSCQSMRLVMEKIVRPKHTSFEKSLCMYKRNSRTKSNGKSPRSKNSVSKNLNEKVIDDSLQKSQVPFFYKSQYYESQKIFPTNTRRNTIESTNNQSSNQPNSRSLSQRKSSITKKPSEKNFASFIGKFSYTNDNMRQSENINLLKYSINDRKYSNKFIHMQEKTSVSNNNCMNNTTKPTSVTKLDESEITTKPKCIQNKLSINQKHLLLKQIGKPKGQANNKSDSLMKFRSSNLTRYQTNFNKNKSSNKFKNHKNNESQYQSELTNSNIGMKVCDTEDNRVYNRNVKDVHLNPQENKHRNLKKLQKMISDI